MVSQQELRRRQAQILQPRKVSTTPKTTVTTTTVSLAKPFGTRADAATLQKISRATDRDRLTATLQRVQERKLEIQDRIKQIQDSSLRVKEQKGLIGKLVGERKGLNEIKRRVLKRQGNLAIAVATGRTPSEVARAESTQLARERSRAAQLAKQQEQIIVLPAIEQTQPRTISLEELAATTATAGELFRKIRETPGVTFTTTRRPLFISVGPPLLASFEDPEVLAKREALALAARENRFISPAPPRGERLLLALAEDIAEIAPQLARRPVISLLRAPFGRLERTSEALLGADVSLEESIIQRRGGFSPEGLRAQLSAARTGLITSAGGIIADPLERAFFAASVAVPFLRGPGKKPLKEAVEGVLERVPLPTRVATRDVATVGFTGVVLSGAREVPFGAVAGGTIPFIAPSLVRPLTTVVSGVGRELTAVGRAGVLRGPKRKKTLAQRSKESRGQVSFIDTTREARLKRIAVQQVQTQVTRPPAIIELIETPRGIEARRIQQGRVRFRRTQARAGVGARVDLRPGEFISVERVSKRGARRARQARARERRDFGEEPVFLETVQQTELATKPVKVERAKRKARPEVVGFLKGPGEPLAAIIDPLTGRKTRFLLVEEPVQTVRGGFRAGQREILLSRLRVKKQQLDATRAQLSITEQRKLEREISNLAARIPTVGFLPDFERAVIGRSRLGQESLVVPAEASAILSIVQPRTLVIPSVIGAQATISSLVSDTIVSPVLDFDTPAISRQIARQVSEPVRPRPIEFLRPAPRPSRPAPETRPVREGRIFEEPRKGKPVKPTKVKKRGVQKGKRPAPLFREELFVEEFATFLKERGVLREVGRGTEARALRIGREKALASLAATFKIVRTGKVVRPTRAREPIGLRDTFREFRIVGGKRIATPGQFIQRRGKRLSTGLERRAIQRARKAKGGSKSNKRSVGFNFIARGGIL